MRTLIFLIGIVASIANLRAALQTVSLTPALLAKWTVTGASLDTQDQSSVVTLPMASQAAHTYRTAVLAVSFTTQPTLGHNSESWPVFELGSAALVFSRDDLGGHLVLAVGDAAPLDLADSFALDADGRSVTPLAIALSRSGGLLRVDALGKTFEFPVKNEAGTGVVISAGSTNDWTFKNLDITADADVFSSDPTDAGRFDKSENSKDGAKTGRKLLSQGAGIEPGSTAATANSSVKEKTSLAGDSLEVFTPSVVRRGRAQSARAAAKEMQRR